MGCLVEAATDDWPKTTFVVAPCRPLDGDFVVGAVRKRVKVAVPFPGLGNFCGRISQSRMETLLADAVVDTETLEILSNLIL